MYIQRAIEERIKEMSEHFPVVMICGPRQVGKTTVLQKISKEIGKEINYVTLDYPRVRELAKQDPELFLQQYETPLMIDEIQYAPELMPYIKIRVDKDRKNGRYFLTGPQMFHMMKNVSESLAGRVGILSMYSLSRSEIDGRASKPFHPENVRMGEYSDTVTEIFKRIHRGGMPQMITDPEISEDDFYGSYMQTYIERDIRDLVRIKDESKFLKFISCAAARTGQELILNDLAKDVDIDGKTAGNWLSILVSSGLVFLLQPYFNNTIKRIVKRPKLYFMDTGLACYLTLWNNPRALELSAMAGAMFETYVVTEIIKSYTAAGKDVRNRLCYYRDNNKKEIDLLIFENGKVHPIEIKKSANPGKEALKNFEALDSMSAEVGAGAVICMTPIVIPIDRKNKLVPIGCI